MKEKIYRSIIDTSLIGYAYQKIIFKEDGQPFDYEFVKVNEVFEKITGLKSSDILGKTALEIIYIKDIKSDWFKEYLTTDWIKKYAVSALNGINNEIIQYSNSLNKWYKVNIYSPEKYYFITQFTDITDYIQHDYTSSYFSDSMQNEAESLNYSGKRYRSYIENIKQAEKELKYMSQHDYLTGLYNRIYFDEAKCKLQKENSLPLSIIIGDINGLKLINDAFGQSEGDKIIVDTARILKSCCRKGDILARTGGDEFSIILPNTDKPTAIKKLDKILKTCNEQNDKISNEIFHISITLGCGTKDSIEQDFEQIIKSAEDLMYQRKLLERKSSHSAIISSIKATMYEKNQETKEHAERLVLSSKKIGRAFNLSQTELDNLELLATLHDIGKVGVDGYILNKPGKLSKKEFAEIQKHPEIGYRIAMSSPELVSIAKYILCHHERWDGKGYPQGLVSKDIPLLSRIIAIVDSFDAMTRDRPYRKAMSNESAIIEIKKNSGIQYDPDIVEVFEKIMDSSKH